MSRPIAKISLIVPCLNEEAFIGQVLDNLMKQDYPKSQLDIFICDGRSEDRTREIVATYAQQYPFIHLVDNPDRFVPHAFNRAVQLSDAEFVFILGAHAAYPDDYASTLVQAIQDLEADLVGGMLQTEPRNASIKAQAIAFALSHPFGVGNATFRTGADQPIEVDTVAFGCYRRASFERFGLFDERLIRNQDMEMSKRILNGGGKIWLIPSVKSIYYGRADFQSLWKNNFDNGRWAMLTPYYTGTFSSLSIRHFIPFAFVIYLLLLIFIFPYFPLFALPLVLYVLLLFYFALKISLREQSFGLFPRIAYGWLCLHLSYGWGSIIGLSQIPWIKK